LTPIPSEVIEGGDEMVFTPDEMRQQLDELHVNVRGSCSTIISQKGQ